MITAHAVETIIFAALEALNAEREGDAQIPVSPSTPLFGVDATLDSLSLVTLICDVESAINVEHCLAISLADDRALSRAQSPYATVATLKEYVLELTQGS